MGFFLGYRFLAMGGGGQVFLLLLVALIFF
jgi:hypothetical protein